MHGSMTAFAALALLALPMTAFADGAQTPTVQPAAAQPVSAQQAATQPAATPAPDAKICKTMTHEGMLVKTSVCHTQAEWDQIRQQQERNVADFQNRNYQTSSGR
jgi:hypothetical protein